MLMQLVGENQSPSLKFNRLQKAKGRITMLYIGTNGVLQISSDYGILKWRSWTFNY